MSQNLPHCVVEKKGRDWLHTNNIRCPTHSIHDLLFQVIWPTNHEFDEFLPNFLLQDCEQLLSLEKPLSSTTPLKTFLNPEFTVKGCWYFPQGRSYGLMRHSVPWISIGQFGGSVIHWWMMCISTGTVGFIGRFGIENILKAQTRTSSLALHIVCQNNNLVCSSTIEFGTTAKIATSRCLLLLVL